MAADNRADNAYANAQCYKRGDAVVVMPDVPPAAASMTYTASDLPHPCWSKRRIS